MKKRKLMNLGLIGILAMPLVSLVACGQTYNYERGTGFDVSYIEKGFIDDPSKHKNVMSSYFNATDMLASLGFYPDYASPAGNTIYSDYLKTFLGSNNAIPSNASEVNTGKVTIKKAPKIMDGEVVDRESILKSDTSTILLNEWEKLHEDQFIGIVPAIIYTSMADDNARFLDEDFYRGALGDVSTTWGLNTFEAFEMLAMGLDRAYADQNFHEKAKSINQAVAENIEILSNSLNIEGKTMLVLEVEENAGKLQISLARSPGVYSVLYSTNPKRGLGYNFPEAANRYSTSEVKNIEVSDFKVTANDNASFITEFTKAVDEIIILNDPQGTIKTKVENEGVNLVKNMLKDTSNESNIHILDRDEFYDSVWGIYGLNKFLSSFNKEFNENKASLKTIDAFADNQTFEKLR